MTYPTKRDRGSAKGRTCLENKTRAQNRILGAIAAEIFLADEGHLNYTPAELDELRSQAHRVMRLFGFVSYPGLGHLNAAE